MSDGTASIASSTDTSGGTERGVWRTANQPVSAGLATLRRALCVATAIVAAIGLAAERIGHSQAGESESIQKAVAFFSLSYEHNLPSWYSSMLLFACAIALGVRAVRASETRDTFRRHWWVLTGGFAYMSIDEAVELHEHLGGLFHFHGVLYFGWVVPAALLVLVLLASYVRFLRHLPPRTRTRFVIAGVIYVGGAVGMELPLGWWTDRHGDGNFTYALIDWVEESLEMLGASMFLLALVAHITDTRTTRAAHESAL